MLKSKLHGQSYRPVGQPYISSLFGDCPFSRRDLPAKILIVYPWHGRCEEGGRRVRLGRAARPAGVHRVKGPQRPQLRPSPDPLLRLRTFSIEPSAMPPCYASSRHVISDTTAFWMCSPGWRVLISYDGLARCSHMTSAVVDSRFYTATYLNYNRHVYCNPERTIYESLQPFSTQKPESTRGTATRGRRI